MGKKECESERGGVIRVREQTDKQKTDRWPLPLQGHKSNNAREEKRGKITGREMWCVGVGREREGEGERMRPRA